MDGSWHEEVVQVHGMSLVVSSMSFNRIGRVGIDGKDKTILRSHLGSPGHPSNFGFQLLVDISNRVSWIKKRGNSPSDSGVQYWKLFIVEKYDFSP